MPAMGDDGLAIGSAILTALDLGEDLDWLKNHIMPFFGDQFFWGKRVDDLKIGKVISYKDLTQNKAESSDVHNAIRELYT
ncbi:MAG: hypothetical protein HN757_18340, partial [Calditrichaeota bacterium]|nr:hypothetical protein [Calditrichota bacterium]